MISKSKTSLPFPISYSTLSNSGNCLNIFETFSINQNGAIPIEAATLAIIPLLTPNSLSLMKSSSLNSYYVFDFFTDT